MIVRNGELCYDAEKLLFARRPLSWAGYREPEIHEGGSFPHQGLMALVGLHFKWGPFKWSPCELL